MKPGDLYWVDFPAGGGHAQSGRRPAIVLQTADAIAVLPTVLLIPLTTQLDALRFPGTALVQMDRLNGLRRAATGFRCACFSIDDCRQTLRQRTDRHSVRDGPESCLAGIRQHHSTRLKTMETAPPSVDIVANVPSNA
jgi:hypothetical protein